MSDIIHMTCFRKPGGHDRVFVYTVAAPLWYYMYYTFACTQPILKIEKRMVSGQFLPGILNMAATIPQPIRLKNQYV